MRGVEATGNGNGRLAFGARRQLSKSHCGISVSWLKRRNGPPKLTDQRALPQALLSKPRCFLESQ